MGEAPKARTTVPMNMHIKGLHEGHKAVMRAAAEIGDRIVVPILPVHSGQWYKYLITGIPPRLESVNLDLQINDIKRFNGNPVVMPFVWPSETDRQRWVQTADRILPMFEQYIHIDTHRELARGLIADLCRQVERATGKVKYTVRGPEFHQFLTKAVKPLLGSPVEVIIIDKIYKDQESGIKLQEKLNYIIYPEYVDEVSRIKEMIIGIRPYLKVGPNKDLVQELNSAYIHVHWKIHGISVIEGGIVPGRLETIHITIPSIDGGTALIEDVNYESK